MAAWPDGTAEVRAFVGIGGGTSTVHLARHEEDRVVTDVDGAC